MLLKWLPLVVANLRRRPLRLLFTLASIIIAFTLFGVLESLRTGFSRTINLAGSDVLMTLNRVSIIQPLPRAHVERVRAVPGVEEVAGWNWFGGVYKDGRTQIPVYPVDPEETLRIFPEITMPAAQRSAWLMDRQGAMVGVAVASRYGWKVGDRVPIRSTIYTRTDGSDTWDVNIQAIYDVETAQGANVDKASVFLHYDYFNESLRFGKDNAGWLVLRIDDSQRAPEIAASIDALFANSSNETKTSTSRAMAKQFADQVGSIGTILVAVVTAVFFTMLLVIANTMAQSVRERTREIGVLKTLGFSSAQIMGLVLLESLALTLVGGLAGLLLAYGAVEGLGEAIRQFIPVFEMTAGTVGLALGLMLALGAIAALWPAGQAMQLKIVDALRRT